MSTLHRRDIDSEDFQLLARFCRALQTITNSNGRLPWVLGTVEICLPLWYSAGNGWRFSKYRLFECEALGIPTASMRRICRYLRVREPELIYLLYRMSMLAVTPTVPTTEFCLYRMPFTGVPIDKEGQEQPIRAHGFVLERRRAEGHFRSCSQGGRHE